MKRTSVPFVMVKYRKRNVIKFRYQLLSALETLSPPKTESVMNIPAAFFPLCENENGMFDMFETKSK